MVLVISYHYLTYFFSSNAIVSLNNIENVHILSECMVCGYVIVICMNNSNITIVLQKS